MPKASIVAIVVAGATVVSRLVSSSRLAAVCWKMDRVDPIRCCCQEGDFFRSLTNQLTNGDGRNRRTTDQADHGWRTWYVVGQKEQRRHLKAKQANKKASYGQ